MLKKIHNDTSVVYSHIDYLAHKARDPFDTGFVACRYKEDLFKLKWYIEDQLSSCPSFGEVEKEWEKERIVQLLGKHHEA